MKLNSLFIPFTFFFITITISTYTTPLYGQTAKERKLRAAYTAQKLPKAEKRARKLLAQDRSHAYAHWVMATLYFQRFQHTAKQSHLQESMRHVPYLDTSLQEGLDLYNLLFEWVDSTAQYAANAREKQRYQRWLTKYFHVPRVTTPSSTPQLAIRPSSPLDSLRHVMIQYAQSLVGTPYRYGGTSVKGMDCSGFTQAVYRQVAILLPHNAELQHQLSTQNTPLDSVQPGDLIFFGNPNATHPKAFHAGMIYENSNGQITVIHCVSSGVVIEGARSSWDHYWKERVIHTTSLATLMQLDLAQQ